MLSDSTALVVLPGGGSVVWEPVADPADGTTLYVCRLSKFKRPWTFRWLFIPGKESKALVQGPRRGPGGFRPSGGLRLTEALLHSNANGAFKKRLASFD